MTEQATRDEIRDHLFRKLAETAESIRAGGALDNHELASVFMSIGLTLAAHAHGPVNAAEWARDCADTIERDDCRLHGPVQ